MITQAGQVLVQLADNIMVGHLGAAELAGVSFANAIIMIGLVFAIGFTQGVTPVIGQHFGKGDGRAVASALCNSAVLNTVMAVVLTGIMLTVGAFMDRMGQDPEVLAHAKDYYFIIVAGFIPMIAFFNVRFFSEGIGNTRNEMWITIGTNLINIFLNWVLIYGNLGAPRLGVAGAAWATLISRVLGAIAFLIILFRVEEYRKFVRLTPRRPIHLSEIYRQLKMSIPVSLQNLLEVTAFSFAAIMVGEPQFAVIHDHHRHRLGGHHPRIAPVRGRTPQGRVPRRRGRSPYGHGDNGVFRHPVHIPAPAHTVYVHR